MSEDKIYSFDTAGSSITMSQRASAKFWKLIVHMIRSATFFFFHMVPTDGILVFYLNLLQNSGVTIPVCIHKCSMLSTISSILISLIQSCEGVKYFDRTFPICFVRWSLSIWNICNTTRLHCVLLSTPPCASSLELLEIPKMKRMLFVLAVYLFCRQCLWVAIDTCGKTCMA